MEERRGGKGGTSPAGGEVGIAESARGDSVIVGATPRTGSLGREKKKGQSDIRGTCPGWVAGSSAPASSRGKGTAWPLRLARPEVPLLYPWLPAIVHPFGQACCSLDVGALISGPSPARTKMQTLLTMTWTEVPSH